jgi:hypothetical protein
MNGSPLLCSLQAAGHGEAEERLSPKLHPLAGLHPHDADLSELLQVAATHPRPISQG